MGFLSTLWHIIAPNRKRWKSLEGSRILALTLFSGSTQNLPKQATKDKTNAK